MEYLKELKELLKAFDESESTYLSFARGDLEIKLKKEHGEEERPTASAKGKTEAKTKAETPSDVKEIRKEEVSGKVGLEVKSPIVGVFYAAKEPGAEPFVKEGDEVKKGQVLCILESMKMMNEIKSPADAKVVKVLCENEAVVGFGEVLFVLEETHA